MTSTGTASSFDNEVSRGQRFEFGKNWRSFLDMLNEQRIDEAVKSLQTMLRVTTLDGLSFVDAGSGSGLFSLAAMRLGARVVSFDFDPSSVWCTNELRNRFYRGDPRWEVHQGSVLDAEFVASLGHFDLVYSWGVLHHTGQLWRAMDLAASMVAPGGKFFVGLYNDSDRPARYWLAVKKLYCRLPRAFKPLVLYPAAVQIWGPRMLLEFALGRPFHSWRHYKERRGMSPWHDVVDWVGGYPYEVSTPHQVFEFGRQRGFVLDNLMSTIDNGISQFVFVKHQA